MCWKRLQPSLTGYQLSMLDTLLLFHFPAFITMNLFGRKTSVWIAFQGDDYEKWMNENPPRYSNWSPIEVVHVSISGGFKDTEKLFYP